MIEAYQPKAYLASASRKESGASFGITPPAPSISTMPCGHAVDAGDRDAVVRRQQVVLALEAMHDCEALPLIQAALPKEELKEVRAAMEQALSSLSAAETGEVGVSKAN